MHIQRLFDIIHRSSKLKGKGIKPFLFFFDFKAAFDSVNYEILILKLEKLIDQRLINFTKWYLNQVHLQIGETTIAQNKGVPQGGIASPIMWLVYINDLLDTLT